MKENEQPIRHQRDPKLPPITPLYRRERPHAGVEWIPETEASTTSLFPWKIGKSVEANPDFLTAVDQETADRFYGEWQADKDLSSDGKRYIDTIDYVFGNLNKELTKPSHQAQEDPLFAGYTFSEFLEVIATTIKDKREYQYIMERLDRAGRTWLETAGKGPAPTKQKLVHRPHVHPDKQFQQNVISADLAVKLARGMSGIPAKPVQNEPEALVVPPPPSFSQQLISRIENRDFSPPKPVSTPRVSSELKTTERRTRTDIMQDELRSEGLIGPDDTFTPIVLVTMKNLRDAFRGSFSRPELQQMVNQMRFDPGINNTDIDILNLFVGRLIDKR